MSGDTRTRWFRDVETGTVPALLRRLAEADPDRRACVLTGDRAAADRQWTYGELDARARAVAARLAASARPGDRALVLHPAGIDFVAGFLGCLYAGVVAVPVPYLPPAGAVERTVGRVAAICRNARPAVTLTTGELAAAGPEALAGFGTVLDTAAVDPADAVPGPVPVPRDAVALLQYTSGSTSSPKGVRVTHGNLLHNIGRIEDAFPGRGDPRPIEDTVAVSWLPHFHDMGLVTLLAPLTAGGTAVLLSPVSFLRSPASWLEALSRYRGRFSAAPDFAYALCVDKVPADRRERLDLSGWEVALNGAEPVRAGTLERFAAAFAPAGFRAEAFAPCYGLAESTVFVTGGRRPGDPWVARLDAAALQRDGVATAPRDGSPATEVVACGRVAAGTDVRIVDPDSTVELGEDRVGEVWVAGGSVADGYWELPAETAETFGARPAGSADGPFLRTGDLGFLRDGRLHLVGRRKDLVIVDGRNVAPQDLELTAEQAHEALAAHRSAAFDLHAGELDGAAPPGAGGEQVVLLAELRPGRRPADGPGPLPRGLVDAAAVAEAVRRQVRQEHDVALAAVVLLRPGALPLTTSGKVQRRRSRELWLSAGLRTW